MSARDEILNFRQDYTERFGTKSPSTPSDIGQILGLQEARLMSVALLLAVEPEVLLRVLDRMVWDSDLSDLTLAAARGDLLGSGDPVRLTPEAMNAFLETIKAPTTLAPALHRAFKRRALLSLLALSEKELEAGEVRPVAEVWSELRLRTHVPTVANEAEVMEVTNIEVCDVQRQRKKRTPEEQAELNAAITKIIEGFPSRSVEDFEELRVALEAKWKK